MTNKPREWELRDEETVGEHEGDVDIARICNSPYMLHKLTHLVP